MSMKLLAGMCLGLGITLLMAGTLSVTRAEAAPAGRVDLCHLEDKVDPTLEFNDGHVITTNANACVAHCRHGDHPMPIPLDNDGHPNRACARVHEIDGLPFCEVNTPDDFTCSLESCISRCEASAS
jgi:hypothetical protein